MSFGQLYMTFGQLYMTFGQLYMTFGQSFEFPAKLRIAELVSLYPLEFVSTRGLILRLLKGML